VVGETIAPTGVTDVGLAIAIAIAGRATGTAIADPRVTTGRVTTGRVMTDRVMTDRVMTDRVTKPLLTARSAPPSEPTARAETASARHGRSAHRWTRAR